MDNKKEKQYVTTKKAKEILGVHVQTLYNWEKKGKIKTMRTPGGHRLYNVNEYLEKYTDKTNDEIKQQEELNNSNEEKLNICYIRVSTLGQRDDLLRQKEYMKKKYPSFIVIEDIGSGINFNRRGFRRIVKYAISGKINKLVVAFKDRLTRFGFDLIEDLIKEYSNGKIIIDDEVKEKKEPKEELVEDVLQILNVYTAKLNGLRKYKKV
jgi:predicted site-specific integrase-resolvase